jgi:hypothetical protein
MTSSSGPDRAPSGIAGLDAISRRGCARDRIEVVQGDSGASAASPLFMGQFGSPNSLDPLSGGG